MFRILSAGAAVFALSAAAYSLTPHEQLVGACVNSGNDPAECACAADYMINVLEDNEMAFMLAVMDARTNDREQVYAIAADHGLEPSDIGLMQQRMATEEPAMRAQCDIAAENNGEAASDLDGGP